MLKGKLSNFRRMLDQQTIAIEAEIALAVAHAAFITIAVSESEFAQWHFDCEFGDEAMFVSGSPAEAAAIAHALVTDPELPELRVGIATGAVLTRGGDVFGSTVNLAARLV